MKLLFFYFHKQNTSQQIVKPVEKNQILKERRDNPMKHVNIFSVYHDGENKENNSTVSKTSKKKKSWTSRVRLIS